MAKVRITVLVAVLLGLLAVAGHPAARPYRLRVSSNGIAFSAVSNGRTIPLIKSLRYEADSPDGLAFETTGVRSQRVENGSTWVDFTLTGPAADQASVTAVLTPLAGSLRTHWTIQYHGPKREFDQYRTGFRLDYAQPIQGAATMPAIQFVRPTGAKSYEVPGDTPYRDLEWQLRQVAFAAGRLVIATGWYDPDWIYRRQFSRTAMVKAEMPSSSPAEANYDFSLVPLPTHGPDIHDPAVVADVAAAAAGRPLSFAVLCGHPAHLFVPGEPVQFTMRLRDVAAIPQTGTLHWTVLDYDGERKAGETKTVRLTPDQPLALPVVIRRARRGMLFLDATLTAPGEDWTDRSTFGILPQRPPGAPERDSPFGLSGIICDPATYPDQPAVDAVLALAQRAGAHWVRIGANLASAGDRDADADAQAWRARLPRYGMVRHVQIHTPVPVPGDGPAFLDKVRATVQRFRGLTPAMEFGNEMNLAGVTPQNYVNTLLRPVHDITREVFPGCQILSMGLGGVDKTWLDGFVAAGGMTLIDVLSVHPGDQPRAPEYWEGYRGWVFRPQALDALQAAQAAGRRQVWFTEAYAPTPPERSQLDVRTAADYTVRTNVLSLALGVPVVEWYQLQDGTWFAARPNPTDTEYNYGLLYTDLTPKPGYIAYAVMTEQLEGARYRGRLNLGAEDLYGVRFRRGQTTVDVLWSYREKHETDLAWWPPAQFRGKSRRPGEPWVNRWHHPVSVRLPASGPVTVTDLMGNRRRLAPRSGFVTLPLTGSPIYVTGLGAIAARRSVW